MNTIPQKKFFTAVLVSVSTLLIPFASCAEERLSVLLVDGRNNHDWATTTDALRATLEHSGRVACHGSDGKGTQVPGTDLHLAPPAAGSKRVLGPPEKFVPILINGLPRPVDGKNYQAGFMAPASALGIVRDDRLAEVLSYIRFAWDQNLPPIDTETVKRIRKKHERRTTPWTLEELSQLKEQRNS